MRPRDRSDGHAGQSVRLRPSTRRITLDWGKSAVGERIEDDIGPWVALSERFAAEGEMNLSKLLDAAAYAHVRRAGWLHRPLVTKATMAQELDISIDRLVALGADEDLIASLKLGSEKLARQEHRDLLVEESPDVFVCRTCGHIASRWPPAHCPDCGSWPGRFRKFVPVFNADNAEPTNPMSVLALLASNAGDPRISRRRPPGRGLRPPSKPQHLVDSRACRALLRRPGDARQPDRSDARRRRPRSRSVVHFRACLAGGAPSCDDRGLLAEFLRKRASCVARLEALPLRDLWRTGRHAEFGRITILRQANYMACHEQTHLPDIEQLRPQFAPRGVS
jgi:hypothetical protein